MSEYAEKLPYFKTSQKGPDVWIDKAKIEIDRAGGVMLSEGFGESEGKAAYMLRFEIEGSRYRIIWPLAESLYHSPDKAFRNASRKQAATMLYHDVKAMCVKARAIGAEVAFFSHLELSNGKVANEMVGATGKLPALLGKLELGS